MTNFLTDSEFPLRNQRVRPKLKRLSHAPDGVNWPIRYYYKWGLPRRCHVMPSLEDSASMETPNLDLRESGSCASDAETDHQKLTLLEE